MLRTRTEKDLLGEKKLPADTLYGIHTHRALENFPLTGWPSDPSLIQAFGTVKRAAAIVNKKLVNWPEDKYQAIIDACVEMEQGILNVHVPVDALQGGAGTSLNMNVNEVLANRALQKLGHPLGAYELISPLDDINRHQSTNDTYPTALKVAALRKLAELEEAVVALQESFQKAETRFADVVKVGRTELQGAVLITLGREMGAYADVLGRDRWRIYKSQERLRVVNLGGTAVGTGIGAPREYIFQVVDVLRTISGLNVARAENLVEATQNADAFVEVSGMLKTAASNLLKISTDLRLMASDPESGLGEIILPPRQAGSSIMPGKVNPVIPEAVSQVAILTMAYDVAITHACSAGNFELSQFLPLVAFCLLKSISMLTQACFILRNFAVEGLLANEGCCQKQVSNSVATATALLSALGYTQTTEVLKRAKSAGHSLREQVLAEGLMTEEAFDALIAPEMVCRLGSS